MKPENLTTPNNVRLINLLDTFRQKNGAENSYAHVVMELLQGNSFLLLPSVNEDKSEGWKTIEKEQSLKITSIFDMDGMKVLGAFTDDEALLDWAKRETQYTALPSKDVLDMCEANGISCIIINSGQPNMFVLERNRENIKAQTIKDDTQVLLGMPKDPLSNELVDKLRESFKEVEIINKVYQYGQSIGSDFNIVLGFRLSTYTDNSKKASMDAVQSALKQVKIDHSLDIYFIENDGFLKSIENIEGSLIYSKKEI
ncbi:SseB family protein [uncultured Flavobacterium sp.]|uniref:SseB family protein n=1 Tax=uncultured Flavobacterium sp. TaxID=165435 RepID=UPI0025DF2C50|nr:SseB family protein [uncultured Flavobacterium sp.]